MTNLTLRIDLFIRFQRKVRMRTQDIWFSLLCSFYYLRQVGVMDLLNLERAIERLSEKN
jgi:hypothetical protein